MDASFEYVRACRPAWNEYYRRYRSVYVVAADGEARMVADQNAINEGWVVDGDMEKIMRRWRDEMREEEDDDDEED